MEGLSRTIPRTLDDPTRILGLSPIELAACALSYALLSPTLRGVPFSALLSLGLSFTVGLTLLTLNRTYPPSHGLYYCLKLFRPGFHLAMSFGFNKKDHS
jgi:hypothetical protein